MLCMPINGLPMIRTILFFAGLLMGAVALAQAPVQSAGIVAMDPTGIVRFRINDGPPQAVKEGQTIPFGARIVTGAASSVVLKFPDGQMTALGERSRLIVREFVYMPTDLAKSRVLLNLTDGTMKIVAGAIGIHDPSLIQVQVGTKATGEAPRQAPGKDLGVIVLGTSTMVQIHEGRVGLLVAASGRSYPLAAGDRALVTADGLVQTGGPLVVNRSADRMPGGQTLLGELDAMQKYSLPQAARQIEFTAATLPYDETLAGLPPTGSGLQPPSPVTASTPTASTGGGGGGLPCTASCN